MKKGIILILIILSAVSLKAQTQKGYKELAALARLFYLQKNYKDAIRYFEESFALHVPDSFDAYRAAGAYALEGNKAMALKYLKLAIDKGWMDANWLATDDYFDGLRKQNSGDWQKVFKIAVASETQYEKTLHKASLRREINKLMERDQRLRYQRIQAKSEIQRQTIDRNINTADLENRQAAKRIILRYGWPLATDIGTDGQNNLWLLVQHADNDVLFQQYVLKQMEKITDQRQLSQENYAFLYDRIQCNLNYKQRYGTQVVWSTHGEASAFRPIIEEHKTDSLRRRIGMDSLRIYALSYGFSYKNINAITAAKNDSADLATAKALCDSAKLYFDLKKFDKAYNACNNASTIAGGMTDEQNYQAAVLFAKIAALDTDSKYKSIALDFLALLYVRQTLDTARTFQEESFRILYHEPRWLELKRTNLLKS